MAVLKRCIPLLAAGALLGCERAPTAVEYRESPMAIHSVLTAGSSTASALLTRTTPSHGVEPVPGAQVFLISGPDSVELREASGSAAECLSAGVESEFLQPDGGSGCYVAPLARPITAGERYRLRVRLPDQQEIRGIATVPAQPSVLAPAAETRVFVRNLGEPVTTGSGFAREPLARIPVEWAVDPGTAGVSVSFATGDVFQGSRRLDPQSCQAELRGKPLKQVSHGNAARLLASLFEFRCRVGEHTVPWDSARLRVLVTAYDSAYVAYARNVFDQEVVRLEYASPGLVGALGLFAGVNTAEVIVTLTTLPSENIIPHRTARP